ncbi:MAG: hypothetical protein HC789_02120 [Microcoleus sp. CSU_2_2]|nr:hypothetical protein [Microcoleus sp. SU_5_3]NJS09247.1 hypothetical protein [Microcoleus sp. CSU_2_2]
MARNTIETKPLLVGANSSYKLRAEFFSQVAHFCAIVGGVAGRWQGCFILTKKLK